MSHKIGLAMCGGGGKGAYQIGVWRALRESGLDQYIDVVSGTSVGALNAALFVQGDLEIAEKIWRNIYEEDFLGVRIKDWFRGGYFSRDGLKSIMEKYLDFSAVRKGIPCYVTGCQTGYARDVRRKYAPYVFTYDKVSYFDLGRWEEEEQKNILLATSAIPVIYPSEYVDGQEYIDGGVVDNIPVKPLYQIAHCDIIFVVYLDACGTAVDYKKYPNARIIELRPHKDNGGLFMGTLNFTQESARRKMEMGYRDYGEAFRKIRELINDALYEQDLLARMKFNAAWMNESLRKGIKI